jgi:hypothetical protein
MALKKKLNYSPVQLYFPPHHSQEALDQRAAACSLSLSLSVSTIPPSFLPSTPAIRMPFPAISYLGNGMYALRHTSCPSAQILAPYTPHPIPSLPQIHAYLSDHLLSCGEDPCPITAHAPLGSPDEVMQVPHLEPVIRSFPIKRCVEVSVDE